MLTWTRLTTLCRRSLPVLAAAALLVASHAAQAQWGHAEGQIVLDGDIPKLDNKVNKGDTSQKDCNIVDVPDYTLTVNPENKGIADVFIYLKKKPSKIHPDLAKSAEKELVVDQKNCMFIPYAMIVRTDQAVRVLSDDPFPHNTHGYMILNKSFNNTIGANDRDGVMVSATSLAKPEPLPTAVKCDVHSHMESWWLITDHPYNAVTDADGKFKIENLPVGTHTFTVWHSRAGYISKDLTIKVTSGKSTTADVIKVPVAKVTK
ncbi:MAG: carboxypeptidase-like regulatory domain-containing protein [Planctomycetaceae bacterium]